MSRQVVKVKNGAHLQSQFKKKVITREMMNILIQIQIIIFTMDEKNKLKLNIKKRIQHKIIVQASSSSLIFFIQVDRITLQLATNQLESFQSLNINLPLHGSLTSAPSEQLGSYTYVIVRSLINLNNFFIGFNVNKYYDASMFKRYTMRETDKVFKSMYNHFQKLLLNVQKMFFH